MVVRRRAILERTEAAQKLALLAAEQGDVDHGLGPGQHGKQAQEQDLVERIAHLALLARIFQILEIAQKNHRLVERGTSRCRVVHGCPQQANRGLPSIQHFIGLSPTLSPDCPTADVQQFSFWLGQIF